MAIEIVDFPINSMVIFHSYVNVYQMVFPKTNHQPGVMTAQLVSSAADVTCLGPANVLTRQRIHTSRLFAKHIDQVL